MKNINLFIDNLLQYEILIDLFKILLAIIFGGIIGNERGRHGSAAGLRTHILVCLGATISAIIGIYSRDLFGGDALRISAQVVSGIGFLGAGMIIIKHNASITGLTTAAGMWTTAIIGISIGYGIYTTAFFATVFCFFVAAFLTKMERERKRNVNFYLEIDVTDKSCDISNYIRKNIDPEALIQTVETKSSMQNSLGIHITVSKEKVKSDIKSELCNLNGVIFVIEE